jgi:N-acetylated-alpha-linked acidic dipeptidase
MRAERGFLDQDGLQGPGQEAWRQWLKHLVYSPPNDNEYGSVAFPGVRDAIAPAQRLEEEGEAEGREEEAWREAQHEVWRAGRALNRVAGVLKGGFM